MTNGPEGRIMDSAHHPCRCCGSLAIDELGAYEICPVCRWEDDPSQFENPDFGGGANKLSLNESRRRFLRKTDEELERLADEFFDVHSRLG